MSAALWNNQWPDATEALQALDQATGAGVKIAILDSGVACSHPWMADFHLEDDVFFEESGLRLSAREGGGEDVNGHGTAVAYLARTIAPRARFGSFRVLDQLTRSSSFKLAAGVRVALERGYQILNCSFGHRDHNGNTVMSYKRWVDEAYLKHVAIVTACNNEDPATPEWPGFFPTCINVNCAQVEPSRFRCVTGSLVEFQSRGVNVEIPSPGGGTKVVTGSSFAAPLIAGYLARLLEAFPHLTVPQAKGLLQYLGQLNEA